VGAREVDDDLAAVAGEVEGVDELLVGGEEQLARDGVEDGAAVRVRDPLDLEEAGDLPREDGHGRQDAGAHAEREVVGGHRAGHRDEHDRRLAARHAPERRRVDGVPVEGRDGDEDHHRDQGGHRDDRQDVPQADDEGEQQHPRAERGQPGACARRLHVDHRLADHRAARHAAEEAGDDVGDALAARLAVLVRRRLGDVVHELGRHQRLEQADCGERQRVRQDDRQGLERDRDGRQSEERDGARQRALVADVGHRQAGRDDEHRDGDDGDERRGHGLRQAGQGEEQDQAPADEREADGAALGEVGHLARKIRMASAFTKPVMTERGTKRMSRGTRSTPRRTWISPASTVAARRYSTPWSRTRETTTSAMAPVAAEIMAGRPPV